VSNTCVVGLQWGDEAKGKIVDLLCDDHDTVVRYQGGANAGHTVIVGDKTYKLSLIPTGAVRPGVDCVIGNGVVIHPPMLLAEMDRLSAQGVDFSGRLHISDRAHVIFPYHLEEERWSEESNASSERLGTTRRGIGPCYKDKVGRVHGIRMGELFRPDHLRERLGRVLEFKNRILGATLKPFEPLNADAICDEYLGYAERLRPFVSDTAAWMAGANVPYLQAEGSMAKCFASDMAMKVTVDAVQVLGGQGYMRDHPVEKWVRDAKIFQIFEGTNQIQRMVIGRALEALPKKG